ncbi:MAG: polysaccharide biosynthesis C-terminal domain-containing protein [Ginsengibacter sp.]
MNNSSTEAYKPFIARKYLWLFLGRIMPLVSLFLITIIYSRQLSYDDYGTFQSIWMYANIVNVVISFGVSSVILSTSLPFLFSFLKSKRKIIAPFYIVLSMAGLAAFFFLAKNFTTPQKWLLIIFMVIQNTITIAETLLIKRGRERLSFVINFFYAAFFFGWHIYILLYGYSLVKLVEGIVLISFIKLVAILMVRVKKEYHIPVSSENHFLAHWGYLGLNEVFGIFSKWVDKIFLLYLLTVSDFAVFFNGSFEIPLFGLLISVAGSLMLIEFSANIAKTDKIQSLFRESANMLSAVVFPLFFFLFFFRTELFSVIFKDKYNASLPIFAISVFIIPLRINNYSVILQCFSQGKKVMLGSLIDIIIALVLMVCLYPFMGSRGIALSIVISTYCQVSYYLWHSAAILKIPVSGLLPFRTLGLKFGVMFILYLVLFLLLQNSSIAVKLIVAVIVTLLTTCAGMWKYLKTFLKNNYGHTS